MNTNRLTMAQAIVKFLAAQQVEIDGRTMPLFGGVFAIFGHGNVAGLGEALAAARDILPTYRAHNEQAMAHAASAFAKTMNRRRMMACTSSIGPGATNMVTAAAVAHVNRLPILLLPGDTFANRRPDPVLQQIEVVGDPTTTANDCFRPVSRYFDRISRPEQLISALPEALRVLTDPAECGPVTLCLPQDVQVEAGDFPEALFERRTVRWRRPEPDRDELAAAVEALRQAERPMIVAGGGAKYSLASAALLACAERHGVAVAETQAGKGSVPWDHPLYLGGIGVTGSTAANTLARQADVILAVGTRLQDFTTGSHALFKNARLIQLNVSAADASKNGAQSLVADAQAGLSGLSMALGGWQAPPAWQRQAREEAAQWRKTVDKVTAEPRGNTLPSDAQVLGAVNRRTRPEDIVVCAAGGLPGELHKLWRAAKPESYHLEYGYSCMGYEIAGGLGAKLALPDRRVIVLVGDGSYLMMNSEIATSVMLGAKLDIVVLDNRGFGCIDRLQRSCGIDSFNNLLKDTVHVTLPSIDFAGHAAALGALAEQVTSIAALEAALDKARASDRTHVIVIETDPAVSTAEGGAWWDVPVPEVSSRGRVKEARKAYEQAVAGREQK
jgi:3D-(3,5/4)-trihydroxycyclohexane-1,2-dione acylhydrolase (decyclizing)